jgi:hypothetical protein
VARTVISDCREEKKPDPRVAHNHRDG